LEDIVASEDHGAWAYFFILAGLTTTILRCAGPVRAIENIRRCEFFLNLEHVVRDLGL